jgi:hypothetical protein
MLSMRLVQGDRAGSKIDMGVLRGVEWVRATFTSNGGQLNRQSLARAS